jgi:hypothetical protein
MVVDVLYEGLSLQSGAQMREESGLTFIELAAPMPVGTRLTVRGPEGERAARVEQVREGTGSGVLVKFEGSGPAEPESPSPPEGEEASPSEPATPEATNDKRGGRRRKRTRH